MDLIALGRLARPSSLASTFSGWVGLPFDPKIVDALEPGLSEALALDAPIEFAVALPPGNVTDVVPNVVLSLGLASTEKAKAMLENYNGASLSEKNPGVWVSADDARTHCAVAASLGKTTSRLVCGPNAASLRELLPYATRGLPMEELGSADLRIELRAQALYRRYGAAAQVGKTVAVPAFLKFVALNDPKFDRPLADVAYAVSDDLLDWFQDLDRITFDLSAQNKPEQVTTSVRVSHKSQKSLIATAAVSASGRMAPPSPLYFDLPATVTHAEYFTAADPKVTEHPRMLTRALLDGFLTHLEVNPELRREVTTAFENVFSIAPATVWGHVPVAFPAKPKQTETDVVNSLVGCHIIGLDGPASPFQSALKAWVKLDNDKAYKKGLNRVFASKLEDENIESSQAVSKKNTTKQKPKAAKTKPFADLWNIKSKTLRGLPNGSEVVQITFQAKDTEALVRETQKKLHKHSKLPKTELTTIALYVAVVPDGTRTWLLFATDEANLTEQAKSLLTGSNAPRLSTRSDIAQLRGKNAYRAGFTSLLEVKEWLAFAMHVNGKPSKEAETLYSTLPNHGATPVFFQSMVTGDAQHPTIESSIVLPRAVFDDIAASIPVLMMSF
jgi:uncharacterized membrane protein YkoI